MKRFGLLLSCIFIFSIPWENSISLGPLGSFSKVTGLLLSVYWSIYLLKVKRFKKLNSFLILFIVFMLWGAISFIWSIYTGYTLGRILTYIQLLIMLFALYSFINERKDFTKLISSYIGGCLITAMITIYNYLNNNTRLYDRYYANGFDPNEMGIGIALALPMILYLIFKGKKMKLTILLLLCFTSIVYAIFLTGSRAAVIVMGLCAFFFILLGKMTFKSKKFILILVGFTFLSFNYATLVIPESTLERLSTTTSEVVNGDMNSRGTIWRYGLEVFSESPILGVGLGNYREAVLLTDYAWASVAHNTYISILVEQGMIGLVLFLLIFLLCISNVLRMDIYEKSLWITILLMMAVGIISVSWEHKKVIWLIFFLATYHYRITQIKVSEYNGRKNKSNVFN